MRRLVHSMESNSVSFIHTVLSATKKEYGADCKYLPRWRLVKLVCLAADYLDDDSINRGWYKHGYYSFITDEILKQLPLRKNLRATKIPKEQVDKELSTKIIPFLRTNKTNFISEQSTFLHWVHYELPPEEYKEFYKFSDLFLESLKNLSDTRIQVSKEPYNDIADLISSYYPFLKHVDTDVLDVFSNFVDLFEDMLLTSQTRKLALKGMKRIIQNIQEFYYEDIYTGLPPFRQTVIGDEKEEEIGIYSKNLDNKLKDAISQIEDTSKILKEKNLSPTINDYRKLYCEN
ncbi:hypothetical protein [Methanocalculus sp.]|uniref:hypothetical protein n=1 Tax=Methanocalculus sp. TaxID=2004547 RepID=UPI00261759D1|nr:hypothetical protein [Methanocalculus sp.]MDG6249621.1 hypothetical protein [Methanocalculus sp.]